MDHAPKTLPSLYLPNQDGHLINVAETQGKFVVIYFYPKAMTSGCTEQACAIRDASSTLTHHNVLTYGISPDAPAILKKFQQKEKLNFNLLSDEDHTLANQYHSWVQKSMYGRTYMGLSRDIFIYTPQGELLTAKRKISPKAHMPFIIDALKYCSN